MCSISRCKSSTPALMCQVDNFLEGGDMEDNLMLWAGGLKLVRIVERPIEATCLHVGYMSP